MYVPLTSTKTRAHIFINNVENHKFCGIIGGPVYWQSQPVQASTRFLGRPSKIRCSKLFQLNSTKEHRCQIFQLNTTKEHRTTGPLGKHIAQVFSATSIAKTSPYPSLLSNSFGSISKQSFENQLKKMMRIYVKPSNMMWNLILYQFELCLHLTFIYLRNLKQIICQRSIKKYYMNMLAKFLK